MERVGLLVERLLDQYRNNANKEQLRITAQLLLSELENETEAEHNYHDVVSVFFPSSSHFNTNDTEIETLVEEPKIVMEQHGFDYFDPMVEIPTLALKQQEINETVNQQESLNDKLKSSASHKEVGSSVTAGPIKDLRKAIGINDQYLFINELFRGDQTMYERSIKTINSFNIFAEAELWIKRELKLKLAWNESSEAAKLFDQLVSRRFA
ncbi:MAG: hypothetical protein JO072_08230 [Parafilimonas sp.]|nr:hypothetical protein [Parafilimonas sp.]